MSTTSARARFTAVVTGGGSGIGAATAEVLAGRGGHVAVVGRSIDKLAATVRRIEAVGGQCRAYPADLHRAQEATLAVDSAAKWLGSIDVLVNCAGIYREGPFTELPDQVVDDLIDNNIKGVVYTTRAALRWMAAGSCIVNIASMSAVRPLEQQSLYAATKAAVVHLGTALARELAPRQIRVNTVSPGPTKTPIIATVAPEDRIPAIEADLASRIPLGRLGEPEEVAEAVAYLAFAYFATGTHLVLDGGTIL